MRSAPTIDELRRVVLSVKHDDAVRAVILTGPARSRSSPARHQRAGGADAASGRELSLRGQHVFDLIEHLGKPVIAAINGFALAADASWHLPARSGSRSIPLVLGHPKSISASFRDTRIATLPD
jgi:enoyl-CoA hydratase